ncbi:MAG TPA: ABC transporter substrate-binding protein [Chloroflexota bacterium]|nr:ABC transporter substrate-binding protein [Chloroflexota bacterium]
MQATRTAVKLLGCTLIVVLGGCAPASPASSPPPVANAQPAPAAAPSAAPAAAPTAPLTVQVGGVLSVPGAGVFLGINHGYFAEEGLDISLVPFDSGEQALPALATGQIDVAAAGLSAGLFSAVARGLDVKIVAGMSANEPGFSSTALVVRKDLMASGAVRTLADLRGRQVALVTETGGLAIDLSRGLESVGLTDADVNREILPFPDEVVALANGAIDAAMPTEPFVARAVSTGVGVRWKGADELYPHHQLTVIAYSAGFVRDQPDAAHRFLRAYLRGARDFVDAFKQGRDRAGVISVLAEYTPIKDLSLYDQMVPSGIGPDGDLYEDGMLYDLDWYVARGYLQEKIDLSRVVDLQYRDAALQQLGRYSPRSQ